MNDMTLSIAHESAYDKLANLYAEPDRVENSMRWINKTLHGHLLHRLDAPAMCLDVGCGIGIAAEVMGKAGHTAMGIDISPKMIEICKRDRTAGQFIVKDYADLNPGIRWDAIVAFAFLHLWPKDSVGPVIAKLWRDLKPGGFLYTGTTVETHNGEGWEVKLDYGVEVTRYRSRYVTGEMLETLHRWAFWQVVEADNRFVDDYGKVWSDILLRKPVTAR